jgi:hypothetical protein
VNGVRRLIAFCLVATLPIGLAQAADAPSASAEASASAAPPKPTAAPAPAPPAPAPANNGHEAPEPQGAADTGGSAAAQPAGHPQLANAVPQADVNEASPGLEPGTISATIVNDQGVPLAGQRVRLGIMFH